jgi:hypothetical protein
MMQSVCEEMMLLPVLLLLLLLLLLLQEEGWQEAWSSMEDRWTWLERIEGY